MVLSGLFKGLLNAEEFWTRQRLFAPRKGEGPVRCGAPGLHEGQVKVGLDLEV